MTFTSPVNNVKHSWSVKAKYRSMDDAKLVLALQTVKTGFVDWLKKNGMDVSDGDDVSGAVTEEVVPTTATENVPETDADVDMDMNASEKVEVDMELDDDEIPGLDPNPRPSSSLKARASTSAALQPTPSATSNPIPSGSSLKTFTPNLTHPLPVKPPKPTGPPVESRAHKRPRSPSPVGTMTFPVAKKPRRRRDSISSSSPSSEDEVEVSTSMDNDNDVDMELLRIKKVDRLVLPSLRKLAGMSFLQLSLLPYQPTTGQNTVIPTTSHHQR